ncbi:GDP/GTP exchange factor for ARF [Xanthoria parietina]
MQLLSAAITHCRFEASDSAADETVLLQILKLMEGILSGPGGDLLGDESVCEMMETGLSMCCQVRLSALLRRSAEMSMSSMCQVVFQRLKTLEVEAGDNIEAMDAESRDSPNPLKLEPSVNGSSVVPTSNEGEENPTSKVDGKDGSQVATEERHVSTSMDLPRKNGESIPQRASASAVDLSQPAGGTTEEVVSIKPYGLPSIRELFRVLVDLLQPHTKQHGDEMKVMALRIIDVALEVAGPSIARHPSLAMLAKDDLCRHLFQLVRSENMTLLNGSLRVAGTLLHTCRGVLKLQQELFLSYLVACLHPRVEIPPEPGIDPALYEGIPDAPKLVRPTTSSSSSGRSTPVPVKDRQKLGMEGGSRKPDAREAMVESIGALSRIPSYLVELFVNYDCEVDRADLCEDMIGLLARNAFPDAATWSTTNVPALCLDALLGYIQFVADRLDNRPKLDGYPDQKRLQEQRARKKIVIRGASRFNEHPKSGIAFLASQGIIDDPDNVHSVASFLRGTTRISKAVLGDFLSKKAHDQLLRAFMDLFDFNGKRVDEALRELLNSFRLPGEAPLIERIVEVFSEKYCSGATPEGIAGKDAVHVLAYAIIILNTDQHNPSVKDEKRMKQADFAKNLRGVNGGGDFDPAYLQQIYDSIRNNEIILPEEHNTARAFDYAWEELLLKTKDAGDLMLCDTNIFDADMFQGTWRPIVATLSYVFMSASEDVVFPRINTGFLQCAQIAARYGVTEALDQIIYRLSLMSTIALDRPWNTSLNTKVQRGKGSVMVSELAVKLGGNFRAKLATYVLFHNVVHGNVQEIRTGWKYIVQIWLNLFANSLISPSLSRQLQLEPIPLQTPTHVVDRADKPADGGFIQSFFSTISSYTADDPPEPSEEELEYTLTTVDCIINCHIEDLLADATQMPPRATKDLTLALLEQLPQDSSPLVPTVKLERPAAPPKMNGQRQGSRGPAYDPSLLYVLELITVLAIRDDENFAAVGELVADAIQNIVRNAVNIHSMVLARAVFYLLLLLQKSADQDQSFVRAPVVLHMISSFSQPRLERAATLVLKGVSICIKESGSLRNEILNTPDFWSMIERIHALPAVSANVFNLLKAVVEDRALAVTGDNYEFVIGLLNSFANAGGAAAASQQHRESNGRRQQSQEHNPPKESEEIQRGQEAVYLVYQLTTRVPTLIEQSHLERNEAWITYWSPIFSCLRMQCENPHRAIRRRAFSCLQGALQSAELASTDHQEWTAIFAEVLFPLIERLLKPEVYQADPAGMSETRVAVAKLLCKIFLHYLVTLAEWDGMLETWYKILELMERLMGSGQGHGMEEEISESLKNILYFMKSDGYLVPPSSSSAEAKDTSNMWHETWKRVDRFLPGMRKEIFSESPPQSKARPRQSTEKEAKRPPPPPPASAAEDPQHASA